MRADHRDNVTEFLSPQGCEVRLAADCREARNLLSQQHFDLVFTDASLPDGNWLTISRASNLGEAPPALVVYLPYPAERLNSILGAGHVQVLMPPLRYEAIRDILEAALRSREIAPLPFREASDYALLPA